MTNNNGQGKIFAHRKNGQGIFFIAEKLDRAYFGQQNNRQGAVPS